MPSGHAALDAQLPGGGWPLQALTEVLQPVAGSGEWRLLAPALQHLAAQGAPLVLVGPPYLPHWPGWGGAAELPRLLWVRGERAPERLWAAEQVLRSGDFAAALIWLPQARMAELRRLQAAARQVRAPVFVFRPPQAQAEPSPAPLRLWLAPLSPERLQVRILKRRGPVLDTPIELSVPAAGLAGWLPEPASAGSAPVGRDRAGTGREADPFWAEAVSADALAGTDSGR